jgi:type IV secretion system protein TrbJ
MENVMKIKTNFKRLFAAIVLGAASVPALAQWAVFDPTNWIQNYLSATTSVKQEITTAKTLIQETQTAINMAKSVKGMADLEGLAQAKQALTLYKELQDLDSRLERDFQRSSELTERVTAKYGASDMSWEEYMTSSNALERQQRDSSAQRYRAINASMEQTSRQRQAIVSKLGSVQGQTEAMQTLGAAIDVLIGQNQQIISILAANNRVAETKQDIEAGKAAKNEQEATKVINSYQQRLRDAASKY